MATMTTTKKAFRIGWTAVWLTAGAATIAGGGLVAGCEDSGPQIVCGTSHDAEVPGTGGGGGATGGGTGGGAGGAVAGTGGAGGGGAGGAGGGGGAGGM